MIERTKYFRIYSTVLLCAVLGLMVAGCGPKVGPDPEGPPVIVEPVEEEAPLTYRLPPEISLSVIQAGLRLGLSLFLDEDAGNRLAESIMGSMPQENPPPGVVEIVLTFDDGPHTQVTGTGRNYTENILNTLERNTLQNKIKAVFFVQTHAPNRGGNAIGQELIVRTASKGHIIGIHTGSNKDHARHTTRGLLPAYDINFDGTVNKRDGRNALESDMIRAKKRTAAFTGKVPVFVRPTYGAFNRNVQNTYAMQGLDMILWDVPSEDNIRGRESIESIEEHIRKSVRREILSGNRRIVVLFHDINRRTQRRLMRYLYCITDTVIGMGMRPRFPTNSWELHRMLLYKAR
jgi:peptidoglycan-N-acetylglucosamine deacetylase